MRAWVSAAPRRKEAATNETKSSARYTRAGIRQGASRGYRSHREYLPLAIVQLILALTDQPAGFWQPYVAEFGDRCVEVDAIPASEIRRRIESAIMSHINQREWQFLQEQEAREKAAIKTRFGVLSHES